MQPTNLIEAVRNDNIRMVQEFIANDTDVNARYDNNRTALMYAAIYNKTEIAKALIAAGADVKWRIIR